MKLLEGKKILVTGASRGIGAAIVRAVMGDGAEVGFTFNNSANEAEQLEASMAAAHSNQRCIAVRCNVTDPNAAREMTRVVSAELGRIDVVINNAGITRDAAIARMTLEQWDAVIKTNLGGMFAVTQPLVLQLVKQRAGSIINITSIAGIYGTSGQANYCATAHGADAADPDGPARHTYGGCRGRQLSRF
jgi:3-oxoacyl-[acyl-carrier protein] reductase